MKIALVHAEEEEEEEPKAKHRRRSYPRPKYMESAWGQWLGKLEIYRGLLPPWRRTGAYCAQHSAVLLLVLVLLGCECQTEQFPGSALAYTYV